MSALSNANLPCSGCHLILLTGFCSLISSFFLQVWFFCLLSPNSINIETCVKSLLSSHFFCLLLRFSHPFTVKPLEKVVFNHLFTSSSSFIFLSITPKRLHVPCLTEAAIITVALPDLIITCLSLSFNGIQHSWQILKHFLLLTSALLLSHVFFSTPLSSLAYLSQTSSPLSSIGQENVVVP